MRRVTLSFVVLLACLWALEAQAQVTLGLKGGLTLASLDVEDSGGSDVDLDRRTTFGGGAYLQAGLGDVLALQAEALYTPKGASSSVGDGSIALNYIDVPLLFLVRVPAGDSSIWPILYAGPVFSFETGCTLKDEGVSIDCAAGGFQTTSPDYGGAVGGGLEVFMGQYTLQLDIRYTHGFSDVSDTPDESAAGAKNRMWSFYLGFGRVLVP